MTTKTTSDGDPAPSPASDVGTKEVKVFAGTLYIPDEITEANYDDDDEFFRRLVKLMMEPITVPLKLEDGTVIGTAEVSPDGTVKGTVTDPDTIESLKG